MIIFQNNGEIDIRAATIMGVNVKYSANPIGHFGTGLKIATAVLLRTGHSITIFSGLDRYDFSSKREAIRSYDFNVVYVSKNKRKAQALGFTTQLGRNWEIWQAYRELYCNCLDENGIVSEGSGYGLNNGVAGQTVIFVKGEQFEQVHRERATYILDKSKKELLFSNSALEIYRGESDGYFYRGVKVTDQKTHFTYNILETQTLTEDRTLRDTYYADSIITDAIATMDNEELIKVVIAGGNTNVQEGKLHFAYSYEKPSEAFKNAVRANRKDSCGVNESAVTLFNRNVEVSELYNEVKLNETQQAQYDRALHFLNSADLIPNISKYKIIFVDNLNSQTWGEATKDLIVLNLSSFEAGTKILAGTIWEEYLHNEEKFRDCTREMQNFLVNKTMTMIEKVTGQII